jgi:glutathione synthase/RimK-type ligase-like ATP-grasp enzyme
LALLERTTKPLIITDEVDGPVQRVAEILEDWGRPPQIIRPAQMAMNSPSLSCRLEGDGSRVARVSGVGLTDRATRIWCRRVRYPTVADIPERHSVVADFTRKQYAVSQKGLWSLCRLWSGDWMNDPHQEALIDENKLLQHELARRAGLTVPATLCTDDPAEAIAFARRFPYVAVKSPGGFVASVGGQRSTAEQHLSLFTRRLTQAEFVDASDAVRYAPILLQPYIDKAYELRVTIVDRDCYAARIDSQATSRTRVDWRNYDLDRTPHRAAVLPQELVAKLRRFMEYAALKFAALDLIVTPSDEVVFLEANPCGHFNWIEDRTGLPISDAIAGWLIGPA